MKEPTLSRELVRLFGNPMNMEGKPGAFAKLVQKARELNESFHSKALDEALETMNNAIIEAQENLVIANAAAEVELAKAKVARLKQEKAQTKAGIPIAEPFPN